VRNSCHCVRKRRIFRTGERVLPLRTANQMGHRSRKNGKLECRHEGRLVAMAKGGTGEKGKGKRGGGGIPERVKKGGRGCSYSPRGD